MPTKMHDHEVDLHEELVRGLVDEQFPQFASEPLRIVEPWGTDNAIWRLGDGHVLRLPRIESAVNQIGFEAEWLPRLGEAVSVEVPSPVAIGAPGIGYPFPWAVHTWVDGVGAGPDTIVDPEKFAVDLAQAIRELQQFDNRTGPEAKNRARPIAAQDTSTRAYIESARHLVDADKALSIWEEGLASEAQSGDPVWVHGDLEGNCIVRDGELAGLIDWGLCCLGDPAVEVQTAWSPLFTESSRAIFFAELQVDEATLARAKAAAINQACGALPYYLDTYPLIVERSRHKLLALGVEVRV